MFKQVKKEMPNLQESQYRREAARRLNTDYDTYLKAWKKAGPAVRPKPAVAPAPKTMPNAPIPKQPRTFETPQMEQLRLSRQTPIAYHPLDTSRFKPRALKESAETYDPTDEVSRRIQALDDMRNTNPQYLSSRRYQINCVHVVQAHEMRRRGYDVAATKLPTVFGNEGRNAQQAIEKAWRTETGGRPVLRPANSWSLEETLRANLPDGGRAWVVNVWQKKGAHIWNVERIGDELKIYEAQSGRLVELSEYIGRSKPEMLWVRSDNLSPTEDAVEFMEDAVPIRAKREKLAAARKVKQEAHFREMRWQSLLPDEDMEMRRVRLEMNQTPPADWDPAVSSP